MPWGARVLGPAIASTTDLNAKTSTGLECTILPHKRQAYWGSASTVIPVLSHALWDPMFKFTRVAVDIRLWYGRWRFLVTDWIKGRRSSHSRPVNAEYFGYSILCFARVSENVILRQYMQNMCPHSGSLIRLWILALHNRNWGSGYPHEWTP